VGQLKWSANRDLRHRSYLLALDMFARITGVGAYIPDLHIGNTELEMIIPTSDAWIRENIGVETRSVISPTETIADMGTKAGAEAVKMAGTDVGLVICATNSPNLLYPATACRIVQNLSLGNVPAFDLQAGCTGFLYALQQAKAVVESQGISVLIIGSDALSTGFHWHDRNAVLFGDGAGAMVISPGDEPGIMAIHLGSDYSEAISLKTPFDPALSSPVYYLEGEKERRAGDFYTQMNGRAIMKLSLNHVPKAMQKVLADSGVKAEDLDLFLPHQTNKHVIAKLAEQVGFPLEKIPDVLTEHGSLSTAVMPVSLHMALQAGQLEPGHKILMTAYGAGFTFGAAVVSW
jgi:3-oxoacyl-[acyl-carrier-protein] synthase III